MVRPLLLLAIVAAALGPACAAKAQVTPEVALPLLAPPPPPPRVVEATPEEIDTPATSPTDPPETPAAAPPARRPARADARPDPVAPEAKKPAPAPSLTLTPAPGAEARTEAAVRALLASAARDLSRAVPAALTADQRAQFETARRFLQQAEEALKTRNLVYAGKLADKAATLAAVFVR